MAAARTGLAAAVVMLLCLGVARAAPVAESRHGMVVSAQHLASEVGAEILKAGGNAVDAAVAVGYALAVVDPCCGNIGGGGFMLIRRADGSRTVIDFREKAPLAAASRHVSRPAGAVRREASLYGYLAAGVPGTVMGLDPALQRYGRLDRARVMAPAIALARDGFVLGEAGCRDHRLARRASRARPGGGAHFPAPGRLALSGRRPARPARSGRDAGADRRAGARGVLSRPDRRTRSPPPRPRMAAILTKEDFAALHVAEAAPVPAPIAASVYSAPPPSAGGTVLCEMLQVLAGWDHGGARLPARRGRST